jgi:WD40 repeat protein
MKSFMLGHANEVLSAAFRRTGQIVTGANDGKIKIWDVHDGRELKSSIFPKLLRVPWRFTPTTAGWPPAERMGGFFSWTSKPAVSSGNIAVTNWLSTMFVFPGTETAW